MLQAPALPCVRTVSKPYLFWRLGLAFERKADAPSYCKETIIEGSDGGFGVLSAACKAGALPAELHALPNILSRLPELSLNKPLVIHSN
jgi:hypothetical protein